MTRRTWVRLDNASNIFLAARSESDPKVFRLSAELDEPVRPEILRQALNATYDRYPLYHAVLRSGIFWYYLQDSDLRPEVAPDRLPTCSPIYQPDRRTLLFRVAYHRRRVILEVFHALSDGTGASWFLVDLLDEYVRLLHPGPADNTAAGEPGPHPDPAREGVPGAERGLTTDSFTTYFRRWHLFEPDADDGPSPAPAPTPGAAERVVHPAAGAVYQVKGTRTPDRRPRVVELTMPVSEALALARGEGVSLTIYLTALFFESIRLAAPDLGKARTLSVSVPVNLRQFFPSASPRNFFATTRLEYTYGQHLDDISTISRELDEQFREKITPHALDAKLRRLIRFERMPALRIVPRILKDVILGLINRSNNRGLTVAISNLGPIRFPKAADAHIGRVWLHVSAIRPQFCAVSHDGVLAISFTSPFVETDHVREFTRLLTSRGVDVTVAATRVTEEELEAAGPGAHRAQRRAER